LVYRNPTQTLSGKKLLTFKVPQESAFCLMNLTCRPQLPEIESGEKGLRMVGNSRLKRKNMNPVG